MIQLQPKPTYKLPTPPQVRRALEEVYALPEFAPPRVPGPLRWLSERWSDFRAWLAERLEAIELLETAEPLLYRVVIVALGLAALVILAHFARRALRGRERRSRVPGAVAAGAGLPRGIAEWEAEARRAAAEGRLRDAALALYQVLLLRLDAAGAVRYDAAKTPGDYRREARARPEAARVLDAFLRAFEPVAFGGRALDAPGYDALRRIAAQGGAGG